MVIDEAKIKTLLSTIYIVSVFPLIVIGITMTVQLNRVNVTGHKCSFKEFPSSKRNFMLGPITHNGCFLIVFALSDSLNMVNVDQDVSVDSDKMIGAKHFRVKGEWLGTSVLEPILDMECA